MTDNWNADGPIVVWSDYGHEGWSPRSYQTVLDAIAAGFTYGSIITQRIELAAVVSEPTAVAANRKAAGSMGGVARAQALTPERRSEIASDAAKARWAPQDQGD